MQSDPALEALTYLLGQFTAINAQTLKAEREAVEATSCRPSGAKARHLRGTSSGTTEVVPFPFVPVTARLVELRTTEHANPVAKARISLRSPSGTTKVVPFPFVPVTARLVELRTTEHANPWLKPAFPPQPLRHD
jgi:hypothetical protein